MSHQTIRSDDSHAPDNLMAKIAKAERLQERMKAANKIIRDRKLTDDEKVARLGTECAIPSASAQQLLKPDFAGRIGFPNYQLTNNSANIRRMQARVDALVGERSRGSMSVAFLGGRMEDNAAEYRIRIYHDAEPSPEIIEKLKSHGFHWSPSRGCWQRLRNNSARSAASRITGEPWPAAGEVQRPAEAPSAPITAPTVHTAPAANTSRGMRP